MKKKPTKISPATNSKRVKLVRKRVKANKLRLLERLRANGFNVPDAVRDIVTLDCYYKWRNGDPKFNKECEEIEYGALALVDTVLYKKALSGDTAAIALYKKTKTRVSSRLRKRIDANDPGSNADVNNVALQKQIAIQRMNELYQIAMDKGEIHICALLQKDINVLTGVTTEVMGQTYLTPAGLLEELDKKNVISSFQDKIMLLDHNFREETKGEILPNVAS